MKNKRQPAGPPRLRADADADADDDRNDPFRAEKRMRRLEAAFEAGDDGGGSMSSGDDDDGEQDQGGDRGFESDDGGAPEEQRWRRPVPEDDDDDEDDEDDEDDDEEEPSRGRRRRPSSSSSDDDSDADDDDDDEDADNADNDNDDDAPLEARVVRLADLPLEQRERLMRDGAGPAGHAARERARRALEAQRSLTRASRDAPREMSSRRPVSRYREVIQVSRESVMGRDPRFPTAAEAPAPAAVGKGRNGGGGGSSKGGGGDDEAAARRRYAFLYDEAMPRERAEIKARLKRERGGGARAAELQQRLAQVEQRLRDEAARRRRQRARDELKGKEKAAVAEGKKPYFPKKSEVRAAELVARYEELKKGGKLERYMEKRRRRNAAKDHRFVPSVRRGE